jgi:hypothetical protein
MTPPSAQVPPTVVVAVATQESELQAPLGDSYKLEKAGKVVSPLHVTTATLSPVPLNEKNNPFPNRPALHWGSSSGASSVDVTIIDPSVVGRGPIDDSHSPTTGDGAAVSLVGGAGDGHPLDPPAAPPRASDSLALHFTLPGGLSFRMGSEPVCKPRIPFFLATNSLDELVARCRPLVKFIKDTKTAKSRINLIINLFVGIVGFFVKL